ncbi:Disease resistance protein RPP8 [Abeliophyllum distichum]|uniref:Disease resistance protein RPP8 n=1 Tax=Abeliophyllum distichum TaxID=126358 RepID=A0ABD1V686_9LAMI
MGSSTDYLKKFLEIRYILDRMEDSLYKNEELETFHTRGQIILVAIHYITKLFPQKEKVVDLSGLHSAVNDQVNDLLLFCHFAASRHFCRRPDLERCIESCLAVVQEFRVFFAIPKPEISSKSTTPNNINELVVFFIDFLLEILEKIDWRKSDLKDQSEILHMELKFLITFLGDTPSQATELEETKSILTDIEAVVNEVGSFLYSLFFTRDPVPVTEIDQSLSDLLRKFEILKTKIEEHCITVVSKIKTNMPTKTVVVSLFTVDSLLDDLKDLINHKADRIVGVKDQLLTIHDELLDLRSFLRGVNMQPHLQFQEIVIRIRDIAYEVEYIIINSFSPVWYLALRLSHIMEKIKLIKMALEEMMKSYDTGVLQVAKYSIEQVSLQASKPPILEEIVVGFEKETTKIVAQLVRGPQQLQNLSIFGMPGLGKTTLAKKLYIDSYIVDYFDKCAWCVVSQIYQKRNVLIEILRTTSDLSKERIPNMDEQRLAEELYKSLKGKRYFIVMDDIWNIDVWDDVKRYFPDDRCGSRILFTTRLKDVGLQASPHSVVNQLPFLSEIECWDLLQQKIFQKEQCPPQLVDIGKQIAQNCHGLPLAVVVMAAILANMEKKESLWQKVAGSLSTHISKDNNKCMDILELSYKHLPVHLKPCFLYFGVFQEDMEIPVRKLIALWISEGFIEKRERKSLEDVAEEYLMDLIGRSLVLVAKRRSNGQVKACNMHDLLRDMCLKMAKEENFLKVIQDQLSICEKNHVSIHFYSNPSYMRPSGLHVRPQLGHSLDPSTFMCCSTKLLRVFNISASDSKYYDLIGIRLLVHLKYLAVSHTPSSIASLHNLEFLLVDNKEVAQIPEILLNMVKLRYLHFSGGAQFNESCHMRVSKDESFLMNNLQNVSLLFIYEENDEKILRYSPHLRRLKCAFKVIWDSSKRQYRYPNLNFLNQLESLSVYFHRSYVTNTVHGLISFPANLKKLTLRKFDLSPEQMSIIGRLQNLEILKLQKAALEGKRWDTCEGEFLQLKFLELDGIQISHWNASSDHFPVLERLVLRKSQHLKSIPSTLGDIPTLQIIEVHGCRNSVTVSAKQIQDEQRDLGNEELKVVISGSPLLRKFSGNT